jgi:hypothetical protein
MADNDIIIFKRDTSTIDINVYSDTALTTLVDITGYTFWMTAKLASTDADPGALQVSAVASAPSPLNNVTLTLSTSDTDIAVGKYFYDIQMKDTASNITTFLSGSLIVKQDITVSTS